MRRSKHTIQKIFSRFMGNYPSSIRQADERIYIDRQMDRWTDGRKYQKTKSRETNHSIKVGQEAITKWNHNKSKSQ